MADIIVVLVLLLIVFLAAVKIIRDRRKGITCTGCPQGGTCSSKNHAGEKRIKVREIE